MDGAWVELAFEGEVSVEVAAAFTEDAAELAEKHGMKLATGVCYSPQERYPGTSLLLDLALQELASARGVESSVVQAELTDKARVQLAA